LADEIKRISVRIGGASYQLVSAENEVYTRQIAMKADEMIRRIMQNNPQLSLNMSAVLALVNTVDELTKIFQHMSGLDGQRQESEKQLAEIRKELMRLREQNWEMKKELLRLNSLCQEYEALLARQTAGETQPPVAGSPPAPAGSRPLAETFAAASGAPPVKTAFQSSGESPAAPPSESQENQSGDIDSPQTIKKLKQTNFEDYLRENGWPKSGEPS
jgi:cell division protein ZapA (FtsZ GTPase activity inhibitor)